MRDNLKILIILVGLGARVVAAQESRTLTFQSAYDRFDLQLSGNSGVVEGKTADLTGIKDLLPALLGEVTNPCPDTKGRPDLTVKDGANEKTLYFKAGVLRQGKNCVSISGEGIYFAPLHREYLIGPREDGVPLGKDLQVIRDGKSLVSLRHEGKEWVAENPAQMPNEDFFRRFIDTLEKFSVRQRVSPLIAEGKKHVLIKTGGKTYEFTKVTEVAWALKKAGARWLVISDDWSFWYDLDPHNIEDGYAEQIRSAADPERPIEERLGVLQRLNSTWSSNLRNLYRRLALEPNVDPRLTTIAMRRLKTKPSRETAVIMVDVLESAQPEELKVEAANILRLQNPKGPKYSKQSTGTERANVIQFWRGWLAKVAP